jgi:hypothetical protein
MASSNGYELLGKYLGIFTDKVEVGVDERVMKQLELADRRAAGLLPAEEEKNASDVAEESKQGDEQKPN